MSSCSQVYEVPVTLSVTSATGDHRWYALHTRAKHEKIVERRLRSSGLSTFLPLVRETHKWSDRRKIVELPLFTSYVFVQCDMSPEERTQVYRVDGILGFVGVRGVATAIADAEIESVKALVAQKIPWSSHPFLKIGQRVRICGGALDGVEGILRARNGDRKLVISIDAIQRSLAVSIEGYDVQPV